MLIANVNGKELDRIDDLQQTRMVGHSKWNPDIVRASATGVHVAIYQDKQTGELLIRNTTTGEALTVSFSA